MIIFLVNGKPKPKPAGCIKYAHNKAYLSMDKNGYLAYCDNVVAQLKTQYTHNIPLSPYGITYKIGVPSIKGLGDLTNIMEALQDCLVKSKIIKDDRPSVVKRVSVSLIDCSVYQSSIIVSFDDDSYIKSVKINSIY